MLLCFYAFGGVNAVPKKMKEERRRRGEEEKRRGQKRETERAIERRGKNQNLKKKEK